MRPHIQDFIDNLDSAVFSGDQFFEEDARETFRGYLKRWEKELDSFEEISQATDDEEGEGVY
jgi:hypothetical protein